jgi:Tfp pilus assembly protein PilN
LFSFPFINSVWQKSFIQINIANNEISVLDSELQFYSNTVNNFNRVTSLLSQIQDQLILMNTLSKNSKTWSVNLDLINNGINNIGDVWLQSITPGDTPNSLSIQGIARNRESVSKVAELFAEATLLDATRSNIRDVEVYNFSYYVTKIVSNTEIYTPENLQKLDDLTGE